MQTIKRALVIIALIVVVLGIAVTALKYYLGQQLLNQENQNFQLMREKSKLDCNVLSIHCAIRDKNFSLLNAIQSNSPQLEAVDGWGRTPLYFSITRMDNKSIEILLEKGANPNVFDESGAPALLTSVNMKLYEAAEVLLEHGAQVDVDAKGDTTLFSPLDHCVTNNDLKCVELLLEHGADADRNRSHQVIIHNSLTKNLSIYEMAMSNSNVSGDIKHLLDDRRNKTLTPIHSGQRLNSHL